MIQGLSSSWSHGSRILIYMCNMCLSPLTLWVQIPFIRGILYATLCDTVCQQLATGRWYSPRTSIFSTNKTDHSNIIEILLKVVLNIITLTLTLDDIFSKEFYLDVFKCYAHLLWYLRFYCYHCVDISAGGLLIPEVIIHPVVNASVLTSFINYTYKWNLHFLINGIIIKLRFSFGRYM